MESGRCVCISEFKCFFQLVCSMLNKYTRSSARISFSAMGELFFRYIVIIVINVGRFDLRSIQQDKGATIFSKRLSTRIFISLMTCTKFRNYYHPVPRYWIIKSERFFKDIYVYYPPSPNTKI